MPYATQSDEAKLPIDTNVKVPPGVAAAAAAAEAAHAAAYNTPSPQPDPAPAAVSPQPAAPAPAPQPQPQPSPAAPAPAAPSPQPAPSRPDIPEEGAPGSWEHRFHAMKGRFDQSQHTIGSMQQQMAEMGDELIRVNEALAVTERPALPGQPVKGPGQAPRKALSDEDVKTYGPELIDFVQRAARDVVAPEIAQTRQEVRQVSQRVGQVTQADMLTELEREVPDWKVINHNPRFKNWCRSQDVYSGQVRGKLLNAAFQAANAPRVVAFFKGFLQEEQATGQLPVDPQPQPAPVSQEPLRQAAVALESLAAPGRPKPAGGDRPASAADKPVYTRAQISAFYTAVRQGAYTGRQQDKDNEEAAIFAAQREGRVRG